MVFIRFQSWKQNYVDVVHKSKHCLAQSGYNSTIIKHDLQETNSNFKYLVLDWTMQEIENWMAEVYFPLKIKKSNKKNKIKRIN